MPTWAALGGTPASHRARGSSRLTVTQTFRSHLWSKAIMAAGPPGGHGNPRHVFQLPSITYGIADPSKGQRHLHTVTQTFCPRLWSHTSRTQARAHRFANCISNKPTSGVAAGPRQGCLAPAKDVWPPPGKSKKRL